MKNILIILMLFSILFVSCEGAGILPTDDTTIDDTNDNSNEPIIARGLAYDNNNTFIGYATDIYATGLSLVSSEGYIFNMNWDGNLVTFYSLYFSEVDGAGKIFLYYSDLYSFRSKTIFIYNNKLYTFKESNSNVDARAKISLIPTPKYHLPAHNCLSIPA